MRRQSSSSEIVMQLMSCMRRLRTFQTRAWRVRAEPGVAGPRSFCIVAPLRGALSSQIPRCQRLCFLQVSVTTIFQNCNSPIFSPTPLIHLFYFNFFKVLADILNTLIILFMLLLLSLQSEFFRKGKGFVTVGLLLFAQPL